MGTALLQRLRLDPTASGGMQWTSAMEHAMRIVVALVVAANVVTGIAHVASLDTVFTPIALAGLLLILVSHVGMVYVLLGGSNEPRLNALLVLLVIAGTAAALPSTTGPELVENWWPIQFLLSSFAFATIAERSWRRVAILTLLVVFHVASRTITWPPSGPGGTFARQLASELGLEAYLASLVLVATLALVRPARYTDAAHAAALEERGRSALADARERRTRDVARFIHDEVLHTLRTIAMDRRDVPAREARAAAARLHRLFEETPLGDPGAAATLTERLESIVQESPLRIDLVVDRPVAVPADVEQAFLGATVEALHNVERHSGTEHAAVRVTRDGLRVQVDVTDDGHGFDVTTQPFKWGLRASIHQRMLDVGGNAFITSRPGGGTAITLTWSPHHVGSEKYAAAAGYGALSEFYPVTILTVLPFLVASIWSAAIHGSALQPPWAGWTASIGIGLVVGAMSLRALSRGLNGGDSAVLVLTAWGTSVLNGWALPIGTANPNLYWMAGNATAAVVLVALFRPRLETAVAGTGLVVIAGAMVLTRVGLEAALSQFLATVISPVLGLVAFLLLRVVLDTLSWEVSRSAEDSVRAQANLQLRADFVSGLVGGVRRRIEPIAEFVGRVAAGELDVTTPEVRATADSLERTLRDQMLPDLVTDLQDVAARLRELGHSVTVRVVEDVPPEIQRRGARALGMVVMASPRGVHADVALTIMRAGRGWRMALAVAMPDRTLANRLSDYVGDTWTINRDEELLHLSTTVPVLAEDG